MIAVGTDYVVPFAQCRYSADGNRFFSDIEVRESGYFTAGIHFTRLFLKASDEEHRFVEIDKRVACQRAFTDHEQFLATPGAF
jgi:hypothetical protein